MARDTITIRRLGPDDAGLLARVAPGVFDNAVDEAQTARFLASPEHEMAVALSGDLVVGMISGVVYYHPDKPPQFWINEVGVGDDWRRRGIGTKLVLAMVDIAWERDSDYVWLGTESNNETARALYRKAGAREVEGLVVYDWGEEAVGD